MASLERELFALGTRKKDQMVNKALIEHVRKAGLTLEKGQIVLPDWVKRVKIDVGLSYSASNSIRWIREDPNLIVFGFEPIPESCAILRSWMSEQEDCDLLGRQLIILPVALGRETGISQLFITDADTASSSLLRPKKMDERGSITVQVFPLSDLLQILPWGTLEKVDYLKLDCQGLDLEILKATGEGGWLKKIAVVTAESEDGEYFGSSNSLRELTSFFKSHGFIHLNGRSYVRVIVGKLLSRLSFIRALRIRFPVRLSKEVDSPSLSLAVEDPTFVNRAFLGQVVSGEVSGFQRG